MAGMPVINVTARSQQPIQVHHRAVQTSPELLADYISQGRFARDQAARLVKPPVASPSPPPMPPPAANLLTGEARDPKSTSPAPINGAPPRPIASTSAPATLDSARPTSTASLPPKAAKPAHLSATPRSPSIASAPSSGRPRRDTIASSDGETDGPEDAAPASMLPEPAVVTEEPATIVRPPSSGPSDDDQPDSFDLPRALASIRKFAPPAATASDEPPSVVARVSGSVRAPVAQSPKPRAAISNLVSRYETLSADGPTSPRASTRPLGPRQPSAHGRSASASLASRRSVSGESDAPTSPDASFASRFPALDAPTPRARPAPGSFKPITRSGSVQGGLGTPARSAPIPQPPPPPAAVREVDAEAATTDESGGSPKFAGVAAMKARWDAHSRGGAGSTSPSAPRREWRAV